MQDHQSELEHDKKQLKRLRKELGRMREDLYTTLPRRSLRQLQAAKMNADETVTPRRFTKRKSLLGAIQKSVFARERDDSKYVSAKKAQDELLKGKAGGGEPRSSHVSSNFASTGMTQTLERRPTRLRIT